MSRFHTLMTVGQALVTADREHSQEMQQQFAEAKGEPRDIEVQAVLDGTSPADAGAEDAGAGDGSGEGAAATAAATDSSPCPSPGKAGGGLVGRPPLERGSLFGGTETRSVGSASETEEGVQLTQPQDDQPLRRFVTRASSFAKEDFDALLQHQGLYNVSMASDPRMGKTHLPPSKLDPPSRGRPRRARNLSVLRLPMVRPDATWVMLWSTLVLLSDLTYSAFVVPISIGMWTSFYTPNWTTICDFLFGAVFFADIWMSLHIGFVATYNTRKLLVMNGRLVARHYLLSFSFFVDLCASSAWFAQIVMVALYRSLEEFDPHVALVVMEGVRLLRFLRVVRLLSSLVNSSVYASLMLEAPYLKWLRSQTVLGLAYLMYLIAVVVNFLGCLWNFTAGAQGWSGTWVNFYEPFIRSYGDVAALELTQDQALEVNRVWLWLVGNYWALTTVATVGFGDVTPSNAAEVSVAMAVEVTGVMFFGLLISSISELLQQSNRNARRVNAFRAKMQSVERWMQGQGLPSRLRRRIKTFYAEVWLRQHEVREETTLFQELPHALRNEVAWQACRSKLRALPLLRELPDRTLYLLASRMTPFRFGPGHDLVTEGDPADRFWILVEGEVVALYRYREAERVAGPAVVGESVLLQEHEEALRSYPCTYRTLTVCSCWMVRCRDFKPMLQPALQQLVKARALQSLAGKMAKYPEMWEGHAFRRLRAATPSSSMHRARSESGPLADPFPMGNGGGDALRTSLARASAPPGPAHSRAVSWGDEPSPARPRPYSRTGSASSQGPPGDADAVAVQGAGVSAPAWHSADQQLAQPDQAPPGRPAPDWRLDRPPNSLAPLTEGQPVHLDAAQAASGVGHAQAPPWLQQEEVAWGQGGDAQAGQQQQPALEPGQQRAQQDDGQLPALAEQQQQQRGGAGDALRSVLVVAERGVGATTRGVAAGATALASVAAAAGRLVAGRSVRPGPAQADGEEECWAAEARMAAAAAPPDRQAGGSVSIMDAASHLPTHHALAWLELSAQEQQQAEQAAGLAAAAGAVSDGGAAAAAQQQALLGEVLEELRALRRDVDALLPTQPSRAHA